MNNDARQRFKKLYEQCYALYPDASQLPKSKLYYLHRQWIFPNHIDPVLQYVDEFRSRFFPDANLEVALIAGLLHDTGLVYKRDTGSPVGHETRSCEYAAEALQTFGYDDQLIREVCGAIKSTEPAIQPSSDEAILVRNADAYSHLSTLHFIGKAHFADDLISYIDWFESKVHASLKKLTIPELVEDKKPLVAIYDELLASHKTHTTNRYVDNL